LYLPLGCFRIENQPKYVILKNHSTIDSVINHVLGKRIDALSITDHTCHDSFSQILRMTYIGAQYTITQLKHEIGHKHTTLPEILYWRPTSNARLKLSFRQPSATPRRFLLRHLFNLKNPNAPISASEIASTVPLLNSMR